MTQIFTFYGNISALLMGINNADNNLQNMNRRKQKSIWRPWVKISGKIEKSLKKGVKYLSLESEKMLYPGNNR